MVFKQMPKNIIINNKIYSICYQKKLVDKDLGELAGLCVYNKRKLHICIDEGKDVTASTLIHEILHAVAYEHGFRLSETLVLKLESALYSTFKTNRWLVSHKEP